MKRHSRFALLWGLVGLGLVLAAGLWALVLLSAGQVRRLPDGATLTLEGESYGKLHPWVHGAWWQKWLYPVMPPAVRNRLGWWTPLAGWSMGVFISRAPNALVLHATYHSHVDRRVPFLVAAAEDTRGREFSPELGRGGVFPLSPGNWQEEWELPVFPRRAGSFPVQIYQHVPGDRWVPVAQFIVPNPAAGPYPVWKPQPLPITQPAGDLSVTLTRLATGVIANPPHQVPPGDNAWTRTSFRITRNGRPAVAWRPIAVTISDATGNIWTHRNQQRRVPNGGTDLLFGGALPASEPAWKLRVELAQTSGFSAGQLWSLRAVPVPKVNQLLDPAAVTQRQGAALRLSLAGAGDPFGLGRGHMWRQPWPTLNVTVSPPTPGLQLTLLRATDSQGRRIQAFGGLPTSLGGAEYHFFLPRIPPGARTMNLLFAVHENRFVEFLAAPPRAGTPAAEPSGHTKGTPLQRAAG